VGVDRDDDGLIDAAKALLRREEARLGRFSTLEFEVPPQENIAVRIDLIKAEERPSALPDLAIHPVKDIGQENDRWKVRVHNIGDAPATNFSIEVLDAAGRVIGHQVVPNLSAPLDFVPKTVDITFDLSGSDWQKIVVDGENKMREIYEGNNEARRVK